MASEIVKREVSAPPKDWLSKEEVMAYLGGVGDTTLARMIAAGRFPRGVKFPRGPQWRWVDVAWWLLGQEIADRLAGTAEDDEEIDDPQPSPTAPKRPQRTPTDPK